MKDVKKVSIRVAFKKVYGETLKPLGFVYAKTKEPCFIRVINNELIHILGIKDRRSQAIIPFGGVATLYRANLLLDKTYRDMSNWLPMASQFWKKSDANFDEVPADHFDYEPYSIESAQCALQEALVLSQRLIMPELDAVKSLQDFLPYFQKIHHVNRMWMPSLPLGQHGPGNFLEDQVICYLLEDIVTYAEQIVAESKAAMQARFSTYNETAIPDNLLYLKKKSDERHRNLLDSVHAFAENQEVRQHTLDELERRRQINLGLLHSYGVI